MQQTENKLSTLPYYGNAMEDHLGIVFLSVAEGEVRAQMPVDHRTCQAYGVLNGGASLALAETVAGHGSVALCAPDERACGMEVSGNHLVAVPVGTTVTAVGRLIHRGRSTHLWNIDITTPDGRLVSSVRVTNFIFKQS